MLARNLLCRLAADAPKPKTSVAQLLQRSVFARDGLASPAVSFVARAYGNALVQYARSYATKAAATKKPAAKKAAATKPTATVKKAVKQTAAAKKPATRKKAPLSKRKPAAKKPAAKKKPVAKKKKAAAAAKPKPRAKRAKKELSPEDKEKLKLRELKKKSLRDEPSHFRIAAFHMYNRDYIKKTQQGSLKEKFGASATNFKNLSPAEVERYNHLANEENNAREAAHKAWVESHTTDEIRIANNARNMLRQMNKAAGKSTRARHLVKILDHRVEKHAKSGYLRFYLERHASGDFKSIPVQEAAKLAGNEWRALSAGEKQPYINAQKAENQARAEAA